MSASVQQRFHAWLSGNPDESVIRWIFRAVLVVTFAVLMVDLATLNGWIAPADSGLPPAERSPSPGFELPAILAPLLPGGGDRRQAPLPRPDGALAKPITFELVGGGKLMATGTITPGSAEAFAAELARRGDYVKTVVLNSPGGSVGDALVMGKLIRDKGLATEVEPGKYCASSCPLVLFGGTERRVGAKAAVGVHQVFALRSADGTAPRDQMSAAQQISARCQRYLGEMGIDLQVWVHAMETPKDKLFVFTPAELQTLKIVTAPVAGVAPAMAKPKP
ncbi:MULTISPECIES: hypothetical protein [Rhodopseudomonas]|uniref:Periplasmic protein-like protein n=1 Tax=Rhodopseudomonas palustris TaxID=1076 RepID=A0A0D7ELG8_RHOPL|nr:MULTISPECIES: hypothetical protein [Rhodopseudomonas]KIZ41385.1 hypothetical protein OO17_15335 [Rhodopseudomonas palustris]MDF3810213.1 hypothetical protein [Rhodopseudomonas sp. BAL398]WOK15706.1 hypothetical protein RBJ75_16140 [Rhodopseudomonas sp. BAL398]